MACVYWLNNAAKANVNLERLEQRTESLQRRWPDSM